MINVLENLLQLQKNFLGDHAVCLVHNEKAKAVKIGEMGLLLKGHLQNRTRGQKKHKGDTGFKTSARQSNVLTSSLIVSQTDVQLLVVSLYKSNYSIHLVTFDV